jgi:DNA-binding transcriptional ArsR family regulator
MYYMQTVSKKYGICDAIKKNKVILSTFLPWDMFAADLTDKELKLVGHPARKRIVELLGAKEKMSLTELRAETGLPVGTMYYHLDVLKDLVVQDNERKYLLSKQGRKIFTSLSTKGSLKVANTSHSMRFLPGWFFIALGRNLSVSLISWLSIAVMGSLLSYAAGQALILVHFGVSTFPNILDMSLFPLSMLGYGIYNFSVIWFITRRKVMIGGFLASGAVFTPSLFFPLISIIVVAIVGSPLNIIYFVSAAVIQLVSLTLGATYIPSVYGVRLERTLLVQLIFYLIATLLFSFLQFFGLVTEPWMT